MSQLISPRPFASAVLPDPVTWPFCESIEILIRAVPRATVDSIALSTIFAEGLELGATEVGKTGSELVAEEQPARAKVAAVTIATARIYPNLPEM